MWIYNHGSGTLLASDASIGQASASVALNPAYWSNPMSYHEVEINRDPVWLHYNY